MLRGFGDPLMSTTAAAQQVCAVACLYHQDVTALEELLGGAGSIAYLSLTVGTWPPSWALIRTFGDNWFVAIEGTTNLGQIAGHIQGSFGRWLSTSAVLANGQWVGVWEQIRAVIDPIIGELPPAGRVHLSGHSYGGAVAAIGAVEYARRWGASRVQCLTIGSPKSYALPRPNTPLGVWHRLESTSDPVPPLPYALGVSAAQAWADPLAWTPRYPEWTHYGDQQLIHPDGRINVWGPDPDPLPPGVSVSVVGAHRLRNYWGRLNANYTALGGTADMRQALLLTDRVLSGAPAPTITEELPRILTGPSGLPVEVPTYDGIPLPPRFGVERFTVAEPVLLTGTRYKVTHFFNQGENGWNESYWCSTVGGTDGLLSAYNAGVALLEVRKEALSSNVQAKGIRISRDNGQRVTTLGKDARSGAGPGLITGKDLPTGTCIYMRGQDISFTYNEERMYRGLTAEFVGQQNQTATGVDPTPAMTRWVQRMKAILTSVYTAGPVGGGAQVSWGLRVTDKNAQTNGKFAVTNVGANANGRLQITVSNITVPFTIGTQVALSVNKVRCVKGVSGRHRIRNIETTAGGLLVTLNSTFCCSPADLALLFGNVRVVTPILVQYGWFFYGSVGHRNTGRANFSTAGRRPSNCC